MRGGRLVVACALALVAVLSVSAPAGAITYGMPDTDHGFVGAWVVTDAEDNVVGLCSGSLIAPTVFLTAGHCTSLGPLIAPPLKMYLTFGDDYTSLIGRIDLTAAQFVTDPGFTKNRNDPHDVGVILLSAPVTGELGTLAPAGLLDQLAASGDLMPLQTTFTVVGYGLDQDLQFTHQRESATEGFLSLQTAWLSNSENPAVGFGGGCNGDSGGPVLYTRAGTEYIVSLVSIGDTMCHGLDKSYRIDTAEAQEFIGTYVDLFP